MESNWRFQVWDYGYADAGYLLVARLVTPHGLDTGVGLNTIGQFRYLRLALAPGQNPLVSGLAPKIGPGGFPFGQIVFPD